MFKKVKSLRNLWLLLRRALTNSKKVLLGGVANKAVEKEPVRLLATGDFIKLLPLTDLKHIQEGTWAGRHSLNSVSDMENAAIPGPKIRSMDYSDVDVLNPPLPNLVYDHDSIVDLLRVLRNKRKPTRITPSARKHVFPNIYEMSKNPNEPLLSVDSLDYLSKAVDVPKDVLKKVIEHKNATREQVGSALGPVPKNMVFTTDADMAASLASNPYQALREPYRAYAHIAPDDVHMFLPKGAPNDTMAGTNFNLNHLRNLYKFYVRNGDIPWKSLEFNTPTDFKLYMFNKTRQLRSLNMRDAIGESDAAFHEAAGHVMAPMSKRMYTMPKTERIALYDKESFPNAFYPDSYFADLGYYEHAGAMSRLNLLGGAAHYHKTGRWPGFDKNMNPLPNKEDWLKDTDSMFDILANNRHKWSSDPEAVRLARLSQRGPNGEPFYGAKLDMKKEIAPGVINTMKYGVPATLGTNQIINNNNQNNGNPVHSFRPVSGYTSRRVGLPK